MVDQLHVWNEQTLLNKFLGYNSVDEEEAKVIVKVIEKMTI